MIIPDPRGMVQTEEQFLEQYESAVKYEDYICIFVFSIAANEPLAKNYKRRVALRIYASKLGRPLRSLCWCPSQFHMNLTWVDAFDCETIID